MYPSVAATRSRDWLDSLPSAVFSSVLSYLSLLEFFSYVVPLASYYSRLLPFRELSVCEDEKMSVRYASSDGPVIPWLALARLGRMGFETITITKCRRSSLNLLANPMTLHLHLKNFHLKQDSLASLPTMTSLRTLTMYISCHEPKAEPRSLTYLRGLPLTRLDIQEYHPDGPPRTATELGITPDTLVGMPLQKLKLINFSIGALETWLPRDLPLEKLSFLACHDIGRLDLLHRYPLKRLSLSYCSIEPKHFALPELPAL